ncbi:MAG: alpha/beta fold hydrolase [Gemmatimonadetes bacterium]|nr:alpha/beta fold hydrolase [Gemmatimonadota bacterium]
MKTDCGGQPGPPSRATAIAVRALRQTCPWPARVCIVLACSAFPATAQPVAQAQTSAVPDTVEYRSGELALRGLIFRPAGAGPHPAVLFLHGSGQDYTREVAAVGPQYAEAGWLTFVPFRRGQGLSAGRGEAIVPRMDREGEARGQEARMKLMTELLQSEQMDDVLAGLEDLKRRTEVDSLRIAIAGNSFGGILAVFAAARAPGIRAAIASAPAALTWAGAPELRDALREAARNARVPVFFFQAQNDRDLTPTEELAGEMRRAGRPVIRRIYPAFGATEAEGHSFGYFGGETWGPDVFAFLRGAFASTAVRNP